MLGGTLQAWLASFQFEAKDAGNVASYSRRVWEEDWRGWAKVAFCTFMGLLTRKQQKAVWDVNSIGWSSSYWFAGDVSSISGSESDSEECADSDDGNAADSEASPESSVIMGRRSAKVVFQNLAGQYLSVHRCILQGKSAEVWRQYCSLCIDRTFYNILFMLLLSQMTSKM